MALYLGNSNKLKININGVVYRFNLLPETSIINGVTLLSSENYILKDSNGLFLTAKENG